MNKGDIVTIYEDPLTEKKAEGKAKLIRPILSESDNDLEYWEVKFENGDIVLRWIRKPETEEERREREAEEREQYDESWRFEDSRGRSVFDR
jgi:hypothetical protein